MLTAKEAFDIASEKYAWMFNLIEKAAKNQQYALVLDYRLDKNLQEYLENLGYKVEDISIPRFGETPYGYTNEIVGELTRIKISWEWTEQK
jgi:hypothetical protein